MALADADFVDVEATVVDAFGTRSTVVVKAFGDSEGLPAKFCPTPGGPWYALECKEPLTYREIAGSEGTVSS